MVVPVLVAVNVAVAVVGCISFQNPCTGLVWACMGLFVRGFVRRPCAGVLVWGPCAALVWCPCAVPQGAD